MKETENLKLKKPEQSDPYDIENVTNINADILDETIKKMMDTVSGIPDIFVKQKHEGNVIITNATKTITTSFDELGTSVHNGANVGETNLIARISKDEITLKKPLIVSNKNIVNEIENRYTKAESDAKYPLKTDSYTKDQSDAKYPLAINVYTKDEVYSKIETNNLYPTKVNTYSKTETDGRLANTKAELTVEYKASDKAITDKAQLFKLTADNGRAKYTFGGVNLQDEVLRLSAENNGYLEFQTFYCNSTVTGMPSSGGHYFGWFSSYGNNRTIYCVDWSSVTRLHICTYNTTSKNWSSWSSMARMLDVELKANVSDAQMVKVTGDGGGAFTWSASANKSLAEHLADTPAGVKSIYYEGGISGMPTTGAGRIVLQKTGGNSTGNPVGVGTMICYVGAWTYTMFFSGIEGSTYYPTKEKWSKNNIQQMLYGTAQTPSASVTNNASEGDFYFWYI